MVEFQFKSLNITFIMIITGNLAVVIIAALTRQTSKMVCGWYLMDPPSSHCDAQFEGNKPTNQLPMKINRHISSIGHNKHRTEL